MMTVMSGVIGTAAMRAVPRLPFVDGTYDVANGDVNSATGSLTLPTKVEQQVHNPRPLYELHNFRP